MLFLSCFCYAFRARMFDALWSPAGKGLASWLSFVISNCEVVTFLLVLVCYMKRRLSDNLITLYFCS